MEGKVQTPKKSRGEQSARERQNSSNHESSQPNSAIPRYVNGAVSGENQSETEAINRSFKSDSQTFSARNRFGESTSAVSTQAEQTSTSASKLSESESLSKESEGKTERGDDADTNEITKPGAEGDEAEKGSEEGGDAEKGENEEQQGEEQGEEQGEQQEDEEEDGKQKEGENKDGESEKPSGTAVVSSESRSIGEASEDAEPVVMLVALLPKMAPIKSPVVHSPPKQAIERRENIIKKTGSPPELHHAQVRDAVQRVTQKARDAQRQMISKVGHLASDTRVTIEQLADEIGIAAQQAAGYINGVISNAVEEIDQIGSDEVAWIQEKQAMTGRDVTERRDAVTTSMWQNLRKGSDEIKAAEKIAMERYDGKVGASEASFLSIPNTGKGARLPVDNSGSKSSTPPANNKNKKAPEYLTIKDAKAKINTFLTDQENEISGGHANVRIYISGQPRAAFEHHITSRQEMLKTAAQENFNSLSSDANRAQFMFSVLGLTTPVSEHYERDTGDTTQGAEENADLQGSLVERLTRRAVNQLKRKIRQATHYLDTELRKKLVGSLLKQGRKARKMMLGQARQAEIGLNTSAVSMAEDYQNLILQIDEALPEGKFLDARNKVPQILETREKIVTLLLTHEKVSETQSKSTIKSLTKVKKDQVESLFESAGKSANSVRDVVTRSAFDMSLFAGQTTGELRAGAEQHFAGAQTFAEGNAQGITSTNEAVQNRAMKQLDNAASNVCNEYLKSTENSQYDSLENLVKNLTKTGQEGPLTSTLLTKKNELDQTVAQLLNAMPERDWEGMATRTVAIGAVPGAQGLALINLGYELYETDPEENKVVSLLGKLIYPGAKGVEEIFNARPDDLQGRINDRLSDPHKSRALGTLTATSAQEHAENAFEGAQESTGWFDLNREAREALLSGVSDEGYAALQQNNAALIEQTRTELTSELDEHERDVALAYVEHNRERAVGARGREALEEGMDSARWGWIFSAEEAQRRTERARITALREMRADLQREMSIEQTYVTPESLQASTDQVFREMVSLAEGPSGRSEDEIDDAEARVFVADMATRNNWSLVLSASPILDIAGYGQSGVHDTQISDQAREYIEAMVYARTGGPDDEKAQASQERLTAASRAYELQRVEGENMLGQYGEAFNQLPGVTEFLQTHIRGSLTQTDQTILSDVYENTRLDDLDRRIELETDPVERRRLQDQRDEEWDNHLRSMQQTAAALGAPKNITDDPQASLEYMENRVGRVFARNDRHASTELGVVNEGLEFLGISQVPGFTPEGYSHATYGREMIRHGRASLEAGAALATEGWGTHEDLLKRTYANRTAAERDQAREWWSENYGEDMDVAMGIKDRDYDETDALMFALSPATWFAVRGSETSGDLANELEVMNAQDGTDLGEARAAAIRHRQQRVEGTGILGRGFMEGTVTETNLDARRDDYARVILAEVAKTDPQLAASYQDNPGAIFNPDGSINRDIRTLAFSPSGEFQGDRTQLAHASNRITVETEIYRNELDRHERIITGTITVMAMIATAAATIAAMFVPGLNAAVVGIAVAIIAGTSTMLVKAGMRGERYGWEEAATDAAMTAVEAATAGIGGAMGGQLKAGPFAALARLGSTLDDALGKIGGAMAKEAITAAISGTASTALQDETWKDGFTRGLENMATGGLRSAAVAAVTAGVSEGVGQALNKVVPSMSRAISQLDNMPPATRKLVTHGSEALTEAASEFLGTAAGESAGLAIDYSRGVYKGDFMQSLKIVGEAALRDMASGAIRGAANSFARSTYNRMLNATRNSNEPVSQQHLGLLLHMGRVAGVLSDGDGIDQIRHEINHGRELIGGLPRELRPHVGDMSSADLAQLHHLIRVGGYTGEESSAALRHHLKSKLDSFASDDFIQSFESVIAGRQAAQKLGGDIEAESSIRTRLSEGLETSIKAALDDTDVSGLQHLSESDLATAAAMIRNGEFDSKTADALFQAAKQKQPDLDEATFLSSLRGAVETTRQARNLDRQIKQQTYQEVMSNLDEQGRNVFAGMEHEQIASLKSMMEAQDAGTPHERKQMFELARKNNPKLSEAEFNRLLETGIANAAHKQQQVREAARAQREKHLLNVPDEQRGIISSLPDDALIELRVRQQQGEPLSPAEKNRLINAAIKETPNVDIKALEKALELTMAHRPAEVSSEQQGKLREELKAGVPLEQRALLDDVPILIMRDSEFEAFTRSKSGQAVTLIVHGRPVVVIREGADSMSLREEGIHVLQSKDPEWVDRIGALDERKLADWDNLPLSEQLSLYRNKLAIEIDAQQRMIAGLESDIARIKDPAEKARLQARLEMTESALGNLMNRAREVGSIDTLDMMAIDAGRMKKPDWLEQPARLFQKVKDAESDVEVRTDTEGIAEEDHEAIVKRLSQGLDESQTRALKELADKLPLDELRTLSDPEIDSEQVRGLLSNLAKTDDFNGSATKLAQAMRAMSPEQKQLVSAHLARTQPKNLATYVDSMAKLRNNLENDWEFERILQSAFGKDNQKRTVLKQSQLDALVDVSGKVGIESMRDFLSFVSDGTQIRKMLALASEQKNAKHFVDSLVRVLNSIDAGEKRAGALEWFSKRSTQEALNVIRGLDQLRGQFALESTYRAMVDVVMTSTSRKIDVIKNLADMTLRLDIHGRKAFAELIDNVSKSDRADIIKSLIEKHDKVIAPLQNTLDKEHKGRLLNLILEMAAVVSTNGSQWRKFIDQTEDVLSTLAALPKNKDNDAIVQKVLDYLYETKTEKGLTPAERRERLTQLAADLKASSKQLREADPDNPGQTRLHSLEQREKILARQAKNLEGDGPDRFLAGKDAWAERLATAKDTFDSKLSDSEVGHFARLIKDVRSDWDERQWGVMLKMQPWFDKLAQLNGLDPKSTDPAEIKKLHELLESVISKGFNKTDTENLLSESRFKRMERAFREMTVAKDLANDPTHAEAVKIARKKALKQMDLSEAELSGRSDSAHLEAHIKALIKQQLKYERMQSIAGEIDVDLAGIKQKITEVHGELALTAHMIKKHPDLVLAMPFAPGTGFDQVWVRTSNGKVDGPLLEVVIGEAKGPGATLGNPAKGDQMSAKWVAATLREMATSSDVEVRRLAKRLIEATANLKGGTPPLFRGVVVQAKPVSGTENQFEPDDVTGSDSGANGYDFTGIKLPDPTEIAIN